MKICKDHRKYRAKREPKVLCAACWWLWFAMLFQKDPHNYHRPKGVIDV